MNLDFVLPHTAQLGKSMILPVLVFKTHGYLLSAFFLCFKQFDDLVA